MYSWVQALNRSSGLSHTPRVCLTFASTRPLQSQVKSPTLDLVSSFHVVFGAFLISFPPMFLELSLLFSSHSRFLLYKCSWGFKGYPGSTGSIKVPLSCWRSVRSYTVCWANTVLLSRRKHSPASICLSASYPLCKYCILKTHSLRSVFIQVMNQSGTVQKPFDAQDIFAVGKRSRTESFLLEDVLSVVWKTISCAGQTVLRALSSRSHCGWLSSRCSLLERLSAAKPSLYWHVCND